MYYRFKIIFYALSFLIEFISKMTWFAYYELNREMVDNFQSISALLINTNIAKYNQSLLQAVLISLTAQ